MNPNPYETAARHKKVAKIVPVLVRAKITADELAHASESDWAMLHTALGIHTSEETRRLCLARLRELEAAVDGGEDELHRQMRLVGDMR